MASIVNAVFYFFTPRHMGLNSMGAAPASPEKVAMPTDIGALPKIDLTKVKGLLEEDDTVEGMMEVK